MKSWSAVAAYPIGAAAFSCRQPRRLHLGSWLVVAFNSAKRYTLNSLIALLARRGNLPPSPAAFAMIVAVRSQ